MSYRLSSKKKQQRKNFWLKSLVAIFVFGVALGLFTIFGGTVTSLGSGISSATNSAQEALASATVSKKEVLDENIALKQELERRTADLSALEALKERNNDLLRLLGSRTDGQKVLAGVITKPPFSPYDIYTLDAGLTEGVAVGHLVLFSDFVALGQIVRSNDSGSKVMLFSTPQNSTIMNLGDAAFTFVGQGGGTLRVDVPRDFEVEIGDPVTLPGYSTYIVGQVRDISFKPQDSFKQVFIKTPVNIESVEVVVTVPYNVLIDNDDEITQISDSE